MVQADEDMPEARRRKAYVLAREIGLNRQDRLDLAQYVLRRDVSTWKGLDDEQVTTLLTALEGYQLIRELLLTQLPRV